MLCFLTCFSVSSQASLDKNELIQLQESPALEYSNAVETASILALGSKSFKSLKKIYNTPLSTLVYDVKQDQYFIQLELRAKPDWTKRDWNNYFKSLITK